MLTGDENIVDAQMIVQYRVRDPSKYLFRSGSEMSARGSRGGAAKHRRNATIDDVLDGRAPPGAGGHVRILAGLMDIYESGLLFGGQASDGGPPDQVKDAFAEVVRARERPGEADQPGRGYGRTCCEGAR